MFQKKSWFVVSLIIIATMLLAACQPAAASEPVVVTQVVEQEGEQVVVVATPDASEAPAEPVTLNICRGVTGDIPTIDPALAWDVVSIQIIDETTVGLTRQNEVTADNELGMATGYTVADDGVTYTFDIRSDVPWVKWNAMEDQVVPVLDCEGNQRMVTAYDFEYGIKRTLTPATAADYAYVAGMFVDGADAFAAGETDDFSTVGVKALDANTLEIKFLKPSVVNLSIAGLWFMHATPSWLIEGDDCTQAVGERWTENGYFEGYGPFVMEEWVHDSSITLAKNPYWPGNDVIPSPQMDKVKWTILTDSSCLAEFEVGNMDVAGIPATDYDRITTDPNFSSMLFPISSLGTEFYAFNTQLEPTNDVRVRKALSMSIDRDTLIAINKSGIPAFWFTHPGATGAPNTADYPDLGVKYDPEGAKAILQEYLDEKGIAASDVTLTLMFNTSEGNKMRAEVIQQMWKDTLGINVELSNQEWKVYKVSRKDGKESVYRSSWVQDYPDANNFLNEVFGIGGAYADVVDWNEGEAYDRFNSLMNQALIEADSQKRIDLYAQAEEILVSEEAIVAPLYWYSSIELRQPTFKMEAAKTGYERFEKWQVVK